MKQRKIITAITAFFLFFFQTCNFFEERELVEVSVSQEGDWTLSYIDETGGFVKKETGAFEKNVCSLSKNSATPLVAYKKSDGVEKEMTLGCIYPYSLTLTKEDAFAAEILLCLYRASKNPVEEKRRYLSFFNWERFMEEYRKIEDPSLLDRELILESIAEGSFKKSKLKKAFLQWQHSGEE